MTPYGVSNGRGPGQSFGSGPILDVGHELAGDVQEAVRPGLQLFQPTDPSQVRDLGLLLDRPLRMLDVGAGAGVLRDQLEARSAWTVDIADLNLPALRQARRGRGRT